MSKIQNERKSQLSVPSNFADCVVFNMSKIQNERKSQQLEKIEKLEESCVQHVKDTK